MPDVRYGVTYSERDDFSDLVDYAQKVEELGFDSLWVTENITSNAPALECFTALSFMAAHTSRLIIGTSVLLLPLRNPILVAQTVNSLDVLSGGRVVLGVGVGDVNSDHEAYGGKIKERGGRCDEALEVIKKLWTESSVDYYGKFYQLNDYSLLPRPKQQPHPPIWVGGHAEAVLRRAARWADAYIPVGVTLEQCAR
ncbi:MAG: TIGR03619 family F420-dependent LLM class oxidoreductase, partial [Dehalococcoidia bacterium]